MVRRARAATLATALLLLGVAVAPQAHGFVYWVNGNPSGQGSIGRAGLDGSPASVDQSLVAGSGDPCGITVNATHVFWANSLADTISRAELDGENPIPNFITGADEPCGVAVDETHVYWANQDANTIGRAALNGDPASVNQSFITGANVPLGVAVDATHLYWANDGGTTIGRAPKSNPAGADQSFVTGVAQPQGVAVRDGTLYWGELDTIGAAPIANPASANHAFVDDLPDGPCNVAVSATDVLWSNSAFPAGNSVGRAPLANPNGPGKDDDFIPGNAVGCGVAVDGLSVPQCDGTSASTAHGEPVALVLPCTSGGGERTFSIESQPAHGQISGLNPSTGGLTYTPDAGFSGADSFTFAARNPGATSAAATATIQVAPPTPPTEVSPASNAFTFGGVERNRRKGTAELPVEVPGAGGLELAETPKVKGDSATAAAAGEVTLLVKAQGKARKKLRKRGKAKVTAEVTFTPIGGDPGVQSTSLKLVKR